ncbi:hypothetical protein AMTRI_Chr07g76810 [Amborella trichopoda]
MSKKHADIVSQRGGCTCITITISSTTKPSKKPSNRASTLSHYQSFISLLSKTAFPKSHITNPEAIPSLRTAFSHFTEAFQNYQEESETTDGIRDRFYPHLKTTNRVFFDYFGVGLFSGVEKNPNFDFRPISKYGNLVLHSLYGDPDTLTFESQMKKRIMEFLNVEQKDYAMVFAVNRESAFKLLAESYPFSHKTRLLSVCDYNSHGLSLMKEIAVKKGAIAKSASFKWPSLSLRGDQLEREICYGKSYGGSERNKRERACGRGMFVVQLQSRVTGARHSYQWVGVAQEEGWQVVLDSSGLGPKEMKSIALSLYKPDFIISSFYKVFGHDPTGLCTLLIKRPTLSLLDSQVSTTGIACLVPIDENPSPSISLSTSSSSCLSNFSSSSSFSYGVFSEKKSAGNDSGHTVKLQCDGLDQTDTVGLSRERNKLRCLVNWLVHALLKLHHPPLNNEDIGLPLIKIYGPKVKFNRGYSVAFNVFDWEGAMVDPFLFQKLADRHDISVGCWDLQRVELGFQKIRVVSVSLSFLSSFEDVYRLWSFVGRFLDADFVEKEKWRYVTLKQEIVLV